MRCSPEPQPKYGFSQPRVAGPVPAKGRGIRPPPPKPLLRRPVAIDGGGPWLGDPLASVLCNGPVYRPPIPVPTSARSTSWLLFTLSAWGPPRAYSCQSRCHLFPQSYQPSQLASSCQLQTGFASKNSSSPGEGRSSQQLRASSQPPFGSSGVSCRIEFVAAAIALR